MIGSIILLIISIIGITCLYAMECKNNPNAFPPLTLMGLFYATTFGMIMILVIPKPKTHLEYLRGNLEVKYEKVYVDSVLVRTDTIIEFKKR